MIYILLLILLIFGVFFYDIKNLEAGKYPVLLLIFVLQIIMSSIRYRMGGDGLFYADYYPEMPDLDGLSDFILYKNFYGYQPLWIALIAVCKSITDDIVLFQVVHSLILNVILFLFIQKYSTKPFSTLLLIFVSLFYVYFSFEIQRETLAVLIFLLNINNLEKKKWINYYLLSTLSFLFHVSAIILFFLPFFQLIKFNRLNLVLFIVGSMFISFIRSDLLNLFNLFLLVDSMKSRADIYAQNSFSTLGFVAFFVIRVILILPFLIYKFNEEEQSYKWLYSAFIVISVLSMFFVGFERFLNYLYPLLFVNIIDFMYTSVKKLRFTVLKAVIPITICVHIFFILDYKLFTTNESGQHYYSIFYPYSSILNPVIDEERENFVDR